MQIEQSIVTSGDSKTDLNRSRTDARQDVVSASIVIGLTAQFVTFIFGIVTDFTHGLLLNILISTFLGLSAGIISYVLMSEEGGIG